MEENKNLKRHLKILSKQYTNIEEVAEEKFAFVKIQSDRTINVTIGLNNQNFTKKDSDIPNRLKVNPLWPKTNVMIKQGTHWYPAEIAEWNAVKKFVELGIFTIGGFSNTASDEVATEKTKLDKKVKEVKAKTTLDEIAED